MKYAMMHITDEQVEKYRSIFAKEFGKPIDAVTARKDLTSLVCLLDVVHRHMRRHNWPDLKDIPYPNSPL